MRTRIITLRLRSDLVDWLDATAGEYQLVAEYKGRQGGGEGRTGRQQIIVELLEAVREGRVHVRPRTGPDAFPAESASAGAVPETPALVCLSPEDPQQADGINPKER